MRAGCLLLIAMGTGCVGTVSAVRDYDGGGEGDHLARTDASAHDALVARDASVPPDAPRGDAPSFADVPDDVDDYTRVQAIAECPQELDHNTAQNPDLLYPRAFFDIPADSPTVSPPATFTGRMAASRALTTPFTRDCAPTRARDTACTATVALRIERGRESPVDFVTSIDPANYQSAIGVGTQVAVDYDATGSRDRALPGESARQLVIRRVDGSLAVLVYNHSTADGLGAFEAAGWSFRRAETPHCRSRPEPSCQRVFAVYPLVVTTPDRREVTVPMEGAASVVYGGARYTIRNRLALARIYGNWSQCRDLQLPQVSVEVWRSGTE